MHYQLSGKWKKISQRNSVKWVAPVVLALLIHCLLLVLFRPLQTEVVQEYSGDLSSIRVLDLSRAENAELAQWLDLHDPSAMLWPDEVNGYSVTINSFVRGTLLEDLPPPALSGIPQTPAMKMPSVSLSPRGNLYTPGASWPLSMAEASANNSNAVNVWFNGAELPGLATMLRQALAERKLSAAVDNTSVTLLYLHPARMDGERQDVTMNQSCGNNQLDAFALQIAKYFFLRHNNQFAAGEIAVVWQNASTGVQGDKK